MALTIRRRQLTSIFCKARRFTIDPSTYDIRKPLVLPWKDFDVPHLHDHQRSDFEPVIIRLTVMKHSQSHCFVLTLVISHLMCQKPMWKMTTRCIWSFEPRVCSNAEMAAFRDYERYDILRHLMISLTCISNLWNLGLKQSELKW